MSKNTSFTLSEHFVSFIEAQVKTGRYGSASDVVRASLRLLEEEETHTEALREALRKGEESGPGEVVTKEWWEKLLLEVEEEAKSGKKSNTIPMLSVLEMTNHGTTPCSIAPSKSRLKEHLALHKKSLGTTSA